MQKRWVAAVAVLVPLVLFGGGAVYLYYTPHLALRALERAANSRDTKALTERVDFPALRANLKEQALARMERSVVAGKPKPFAAMSRANLAGALSDPVDALVNPLSLAWLLRGGNLGGAHSAGLRVEGSQIEFGDVGMNRFEATTGPAPEGFTLVLARDGWFDWKLVDVALPASWSFGGS